MGFDEFIESAWNDHAEHTEDVASRLADSVHLIESPAHVPPYVRLVTHVYGEHLGRWRDGVELLESLHTVTSCDDNPTCKRAVKRAVATLRYADGDLHALEPLGPEDRIAALATASSALAGQNRFDDALATYSAATALVHHALAPDSIAIRALAVAGNNLAAALEAKTDRSKNESDGMVGAARAALKYWKLAGTWLEEERAHYRLSRSLLLAGDAEGALASAKDCADICREHDAPPFEQFFAQAALALAYRAHGDRPAFESARAKAAELHARVAPDEKPSCEGELNLLSSEA